MNTCNPSWASLAHANYVSGRSGQDPLQTANSLLLYKGRGTLNHPIDEIEGPYFRLLRIQPDEHDAPLRAELIPRPVFDAPPYTALSYSWGDTSDPSRSIDIGELSFQVSAHLYKALLVLRDRWDCVNVWVDAICINQHDPLDKAGQVQIMSQIYSEAQQLAIWFGDIGSFDLRIPTWTVLHSSGKRVWWKRLWILQECAYARKCPVVLLNNRTTIPLGELIQRCSEALDQSSRLRKVARRSCQENLDFLRLPYSFWEAAVKGNKLKTSLLQRLRETARRQFSDPRDRIYALLSLVNEDESEPIRPDYGENFIYLRNRVEAMLRRSRDWDEERDRNILALTSDSEVHVVSEGILESASKGGRQLLREFLRQSSTVPHIDIKVLHAAIVTAVEIDPSIERMLPERLDLSQTDEDNFIHRSVMPGNLTAANPSPLVPGGHACAPNRSRENELHVAAYTGDSDKVRLLIQRGTDVDVRDDISLSALQLASAEGHTKVVQLLLDAGAKVEVDRSVSGTALQMATSRGHLEIVRLLLKAGADVEACREESINRTHTPLCVAAVKGYHEVVRTLLEAGADVNASSSDVTNVPTTALHGAGRSGHLEIVRTLLKAGANVNANRYGRLLIESAFESQNWEIVELLAIAGADIRSIWRQLEG